MMAKFGKIDSQTGKLIYAPAVLRPASGGFVINPGEETLRKDGFLPIEEVIPEHDDNDLISLLKYEESDGKIVCTYEVVEISDSSDSAIDDAILDLQDQIANLSSQNAYLLSRNAELNTANEALVASQTEQSAAAEQNLEQYYEEHSKVLDLQSEIASLEAQFEDTAEITRQRDFYRNVAVKGQYLEQQNIQEVHESIICYGGDSSDSNSSDEDETKFYKNAYIVSPIEFEPLKIYKVTDGIETRYLVYTPPDRALSIGGIYYPIVEAHGGDWVEINPNEEESDSSSLEESEANEIVIYCYQDTDGKVHVGTKLPETSFSSMILGRILIEEDSSNSDSSIEA